MSRREDGAWPVMACCGEAPTLTEENFPATAQSFNQIEIMLRIKSYIPNEKTEHQIKQNKCQVPQVRVFSDMGWRDTLAMQGPVPEREGFEQDCRAVKLRATLSLLGCWATLSSCNMKLSEPISVRTKDEYVFGSVCIILLANNFFTVTKIYTWHSINCSARSVCKGPKSGGNGEFSLRELKTVQRGASHLSRTWNRNL